MAGIPMDDEAQVENQAGAALPTGVPILWASEHLGRKIAFATVGTPAAAVIFTRPM